MREDEIRRAIESLSGDQFERFAIEILRREQYPGLVATSRSHDLGEDARTPPSLASLHDNKMVSVAVSKTGSWSKIESDCVRCRETDREIDILVYVTAKSPQASTQERWKQKVKEEFGWSLEVRTIDWLAPTASSPPNEDLADDYLDVPPLGHDFTSRISNQFCHHTNRAIKHIRISIPGIAEPFERPEFDRCEDWLQKEQPVVLTGKAGTGKSGIAKKLVVSAKERNLGVLLLDARQVSFVNDEAQLRQHLGLRGPVRSAFRRIGHYDGCRLVIDQLDNAAGLRAGTVLVELAKQCSTLGGVETVIVSRKRESQEFKLLESLLSAGFVEVVSHPLSENQARDNLQAIGISDPSEELTELARNLLNLEIIGKIKQTDPALDISSVRGEVDLWDQYRETLSEREGPEVVAEAIRLARQGLSSMDGKILLDHPRPRCQRRLVSTGVLVLVHGRVTQFFHEKLRDFLYAWDATEQGLMSSDVVEEINAYKTRHVMQWMSEIYAQSGSPLYASFLKEVLNV